ncbi:MAG TPA: VOC family protein [Candidatus Saccharimonadales bacterium]|nr:VOC family protein [Candidatus Saccharimonadales bacterium]
MDDIVLEPYIFFKGNCREAMEFYKSVFGGELRVTTYKDAGVSANGTNPDWLMHASLEGGAVKLMGSDTAQASPRAMKVTLSLGGKDETRMRRIFDALSADGDVISPLKKEAWGDLFGSFTDKYGVEWMMNIGSS